MERYGKYILLNLDHLDQAHRFFERFGVWAILLGRMLPVVRTFIALPAGIAKMDRTRFHLFTFIGSLPWCVGLAWVGYLLGRTLGNPGRYLPQIRPGDRPGPPGRGRLVRLAPHRQRPAQANLRRGSTMGIPSGDGHGDP